MTRLGLWGARGDRRGLHVQAAEFARHMKPVKVMGFDQRSVGWSKLHCDWSDYADSDLTIMDYRKAARTDAMRWLEGLDVVWGVETFYQDAFPAWAKEAGAATIQHVNPEFYRFDQEPKLPRPTIELAPSSWRIGQMSGVATALPTPVALDRLPFRQRPLGEPLTFLHVVGVQATDDRNGSQCIADALPHVREPCKLLVRAQRVTSLRTGRIGNVDVELLCDDIPHYWDLYDEGDALLMPRRYGGQCLPIQEAAARGIPSVMTDVQPNRGWLSESCLIPSVGTSKLRTQAGTIDMHEPGPQTLAAIMDRMSCNPLEVHNRSVAARCWAESISWDALAAEYQNVIEMAVAIASR